MKKPNVSSEGQTIKWPKEYNNLQNTTQIAKDSTTRPPPPKRTGCTHLVRISTQ